MDYAGVGSALRRHEPNDNLVAVHNGVEVTGIFSKVSPRVAVFSHRAGTAAMVEQTRQSYSGRVEMGEDLMVIDIGEQVRVKHASAPAPPK